MFRYLLAQATVTPIPDGIFWYSLSTLLALSLIWVLQRYVNKTEKLLERLVADVSLLKINEATQDTTLKEHGKDILALETRINGLPHVNYK